MQLRTLETLIFSTKAKIIQNPKLRRFYCHHVYLLSTLLFLTGGDGARLVERLGNDVHHGVAKTVQLGRGPAGRHWTAQFCPVLAAQSCRRSGLSANIPPFAAFVELGAEFYADSFGGAACDGSAYILPLS